MTHVAGASSEGRTKLFGRCVSTDQGRGGHLEAARLDVTRACLRRSRQRRGAAFPIPLAEMVHGAAITEAVVRSAATGQIQQIS